MLISNSRSLRAAGLMVVSLVVLSGCNGRTILHGSNLHKHALANLRKSIEPEMLNVWFVKSDGAGLKVVSVSRRANRPDKLYQALEELLEGPDSREENSGLGTEIPRGTLLLGLKRTGKTIDVNLSRRFASGGGSSSFLVRLEQLKRTISEPAGASDVYLNIEGKRLNVEEGEGIEIRQPINR